jgi:hypothetical protein
LTRSLAPLRCNTSPLMVWMPCCLSLSHFTGSGCPSFLSAHACARAFHCLRCVEQPETQHETRRYDTDGFWNGYHRAASSVRYIRITQLLSTLHPPQRVLLPSLICLDRCIEPYPCADRPLLNRNSTCSRRIRFRPNLA